MFVPATLSDLPAKPSVVIEQEIKKTGDKVNAENRGTWKEFEDLVERIHRSFHSKAKIVRNDHIRGINTGESRQVDIAIRYNLGPNQLLIIVECKRHSRKLGVSAIGAFIATRDDVRANLAIMVSETGFTRGARNLADRNGIKTYTLRDTRESSWANHITIPIFVEMCELHVLGNDVVRANEEPVEIPPGETLDLVDKRTGQETTVDDLLREIWKSGDKPEGEFGFACPMHDEHGNQFRMRFRIRADISRFERAASLQLLGLVDTADGATHTDAFRIAAEPDKDVVYHSNQDFWKNSKIPFSVFVTNTTVTFPGDKNDRSRRLRGALENKLGQFEISVKAGPSPIVL